MASSSHTNIPQAMDHPQTHQPNQLLLQGSGIWFSLVSKDPSPKDLSNCKGSTEVATKTQRWIATSYRPRILQDRI